MKLLGGLNRDVAHVDQPAGTYRRARNMILDDLAGAIANEMSPALLSAVDGPNNRFQNMELCGQFQVPGDRVIFAVKARETSANSAYDANKAEQILELSEDGTVTELASGVAGTFTISASTPFQGVGYVNGAGDLVLVYTDGTNKPRYIVYDESTQEASGPFLVFPEAKFPMVRPAYNGANDTTGDILAGSYTFILAYEVQSGTNNLTQFGPAIGAWQIGAESTDENKSFRGSAKMTFYGLDDSYEYVRVYAVRTFNGTETVTYADRFPVISNQQGQEWSYVGQEVTTSTETADSLFIPRPTYISAETVAVSDDRMFLANLGADNITFEDAQTVANNINVYWTVDEVGLWSDDWDAMLAEELSGLDRIISYPDSNWVGGFPNRDAEDNARSTLAGQEVVGDWGGLLGGFMPGEVYALYIAFLKNDGTWSQAYHIPAGGDSGSYASTAREDAASLNVLTRNINPDPTAVGLTMYTCGKTGYHLNGSEEYGDSTAWSNVGLDGTSVRHHIMPTPKQAWQATTAASGSTTLSSGQNEMEWANQTISLYVDNVVIPASIQDKIQGFKIFYAKPNTVNDRKIKAYAPVWRWTHDNSEGNDLLRVYDPYLMAAKPEASGWSVEEVYKQMSYNEVGGWTMQSDTVTDYAYLPSNVIYGDFDNEFREPCLALQMASSVDHQSDWMAGYPGYVAGEEDLGLSEISSYYSFTPSSGIGYHVQSDYDSLATAEILQDFEESYNVLTYSFASTFGSYSEINSATPAGAAFKDTDRPDKSASVYNAVYYANTTPGTGAYYYSDSAGDTTQEGSGALPQGTYLGFGGAMGSFACIYEDSADFFLDYEGWDLAGTHDFVAVDGAGTYSSNQPVRGGDTWITPVVVEWMSPFNYQSSFNPKPANASVDYDYLAKVSYFTWSHVQASKNDLAGTLTWQNLANNWGVGTGDTRFYGQDFNTYNFGSHWFVLDEKKSAFPQRENTLEVSGYPNRIIRSDKQSYESTEIAWTNFVVADYYDNAFGKDSIRNIEDYKGELIIHHGNAIFKTRSQFNFDASGTNVYVGSGDIFQAPPVELFVDTAGYAGVAHWSDTLLSRAGYTWVDRNAGKVFNLTDGLSELSAKGLRNYMRDEFVSLDTANMTIPAGVDIPTIYSYEQGGFTIGFDPYNDRLLITKRYQNSNTTVTGETLSYSMRNQCWASNHEYVPYQYFQTYNKLFCFNEATNLASINEIDGSLNTAGVFEVNGTFPGIAYGTDLRAIEGAYSSYVDAAFNMEPSLTKVWQNINWITRYGEGDGDIDREVTFDNARIYNDHQISQTNTNFRLTDNRWQWNEFRDDSNANAVEWFDSDSNSFLPDATILDLTKQWYERQRFVSPAITVRLETLNTGVDRLYLLDVGATARRAVR